jgi:hypothetical protein
MTKRLAGSLAVAALLLAAPTQVTAQVKLGYTDVGGVIGLGNLAGASLSLGGRFEKVFKALPNLGDGLLGIGVSADVYSYSGAGYKLRYIPIGATANYHFKLDPKNKLDVFLGAGLGFSGVSCSIVGTGNCGGFGSNVYFIGRAGGRYFWKPNLAAYADLGAGAATINLGLMVKLR